MKILVTATQTRHPGFSTSLGILIASASLFILLRTQQYLAVDGALRCLPVYWNGRPTLGGNNHLLYFVNVFVWTKALSLAGVNATDAFDFVKLTHWIDALAAAGSVSLLWMLSFRATENARAAWAASCAFAFSNAFMLHATSTAEPMVGLFWSLASVLIVASGLAASSRLRLFVGGILLLLAMATYESMVLVGPSELLFIYYWDEQRVSRNRSSALWFLAGCIFGGIAIYVPAYALSGTVTPLAIVHRFFEMGGGEQVYGGVSISKPLNLPFGFANSIVAILPADYQGIRSLLRLHSQDRWIVLTSTAVLLSIGWLAWTSIRLAWVWADLERRQRLILGCCAVALVLDIFALIFWDPLYDKLWLQPLAVVFLASSVILAAWYQRCPRRPIVPEILIIALVMTTGFFHALEARRSSTPCLAAASELTGTLRSSDLLISGWDPPSLLYSSFWRNGAKTFDFPSSATVNGPKMLPILDDEISRIMASGGRVYFLGVLDMPEAVWKPYLEDRCHLPYHSLDAIRKCAMPVEKLSCNSGDEVLWRLSLRCYRPSK